MADRQVGSSERVSAPEGRFSADRRGTATLQCTRSNATSRLPGFDFESGFGFVDAAAALRLTAGF
jgi:hypothetical protein